MNKRLVLYHGDCMDGFCAAWCAYVRFGSDGIEAIPVQYGQAPPSVKGRFVYILDFSYPRDVLTAMCDEADFVVVLDHHKTAQAALTDYEHLSAHIKFDMTKSGGRLAWEHFFPGIEPPWLVQYTEDRDLWKWQMPESRAINACLRSLPTTFIDWDKYSNRGANSMVEPGIAILRSEQAIVAQHVKRARMGSIAGYTIPVINATVLQSEITGELAKGYPFAASYYDIDGMRCWSLRSAEDGIDVSEIAKQFGGGGHKHAAGFSIKGHS